MRKLLTVCFLLAAMPLMAGQGPTNAYGMPYEIIDNKGLDLASNSFALTNVGRQGMWGLLLVYVTVTDANNSVTALNMSCTGSVDDNTTDYTLQDCSVAAGVATCSNLSWTKNPAAITSPKKWLWRVDIEGIEDIECTLTDTGGIAADLLDVTIALAVKG